ncbi:YaiI/YqxD family protein [Vampirovibrio sp.]|uniref:YaiI/YqxD family protein n=1 Tax=Vampirovibrio sp. TaxID=2717857 RepID=UPI0035933CF6
MKIWVDADACPGAVRDIILRAANRLVLHTTFVANKALCLPVAPHLYFVQVAAGPDVVDLYIIEQAQQGELVITQDIPLAAQLVNQGVTVISPHGTLFTDGNIGDRLASRNLMSDLRDTGMITGGPKPFGEKEKRAFANAFDQTLTRLLKDA